MQSMISWASKSRALIHSMSLAINRFIFMLLSSSCQIVLS
jgi:hypothetical protein